MPTTKSNIIAKTIKRFKPMLKHFSIEAYRASQDRFGMLKPIPKSITHEAEPNCSVKCEWYRPATTPAEKVILYLHGGAYLAGGLPYCRALSTAMACNSGISVIACEYRLAPENPYPAALEDAVTVYEFLLSNDFKPENIAFMGDSAGGGLALALALYLRDNKKSLPAAIVCFSAWTDLTICNPSYTNKEVTDPTLNPDILKENALQYACEADLMDPYISPFYGDHTGMPPILLQTCTNEILMDDSRLLYDKVLSYGVDVTLEIWEGMWHVFQLMDVVEAHQALGSAGAFLRRNLKIGTLCVGM